MKKWKFVFCLCLISMFCIPLLNVQAKTDKFVMTNGNDTTSDQDVNGSAVYFGNNVTTEHTIEGINMTFGNNVNLKGNSDYIVLAGNNIQAIGKVNRDGVIAGNTITLDSSFEIDRDLFIFGNTVTISGKMNRDVTVYAASIIVKDATVASDMKLYAGNIQIKENVEIVGTLSYNKDANFTKEENAKIGNTVLLEELTRQYTFSERAWSAVVSYLGTLLVFLALAFIVPKLWKRIDRQAKKMTVFDVLTTMGLGAMSIIVAPVLVLLLISLVFGVPLAILFIVVFAIAVALSMIFSGYLLGTALWNRAFKQKDNVLLSGFIGITILTALSFVPIVSSILMIVGLLIGIGTILLLFKKEPSID